MLGSRAVLALTLTIHGSLTACLIDPMGKARQRVRAGESAIERRDFAAAQSELDAAERSSEDDVALQRRIRVARQKLERELVQNHASATGSTGTSETIRELWSLRERNARSGGTATLEQQLVIKLRQSASLFLQAQEAIAAAGRASAAFAAASTLLKLPAVDDEIGGDRRILALANQAALVHLSRADSSAAAPLARRGHQGLAARYLGGTVSDASAMTAPFVPVVAIRGTPSAACAAVSTNVEQRLARTGRGRRVDVELALTNCRDSETSDTTVATATWTEMVLTPERVQIMEESCRSESVEVTHQSCEFKGFGSDDRGIYYCVPITSRQSQYVCMPRPKWIDTLVPRPVQRSAPRSITTTKASVTLTGSYVVRKDGAPDRRGTINQALVRTDTSYPAVGGAPAKDRDARSRTPAMLDDARTAIEAQLTREIDAALAVDIAAATTAALEAAAAGRIDVEEEALMRAVLLGGNTAGALETRYGTTAADLRDAFARTTFTSLATRVAMVLPAADTIPELSAGERAEVERQIATGYATPMVLPQWFTIGIGGFALPERAAPDGSAVLGFKGMAISVRAGTMVLGRLRKARFGPLLVDDASVHVDGGFALSSAADQLTGGTRLVAGADYTAAIGWRTRRFGGVFAGLRASAAYEVLDGGTLGSLPLFARVELPLPTGSLTLEAFGRPLAGSDASGFTAYVTGENRQRGDRSNLFFAVRVERGPYDARATYTNAAFEDIELAFPDVVVTTIGLELGAGF